MATKVDIGPNDDSVFLQLAGRKLKNRLGSTLNEGSGGSTVPAFAKKQLEKLGWKPGEGLGKRRQGMVSHIKVTKRAEGLGLGESTLDPAIAQSLNADDWWKNSVGDTLAKLAGANKKTKKEKKNKDGKKKKVYTDEELFEATGGARFGMRAQRRQDGKWKRAESNISEQDEQDALKKVEWDGRTAPKVVLSSEDKKSSSKKRKSTEEEVLEATPDEKSERKRQKKQRRKEEESTDQSSTDKKKKKAKKSKTSKDQ